VATAGAHQKCLSFSLVACSILIRLFALFALLAVRGHTDPSSGEPSRNGSIAPPAVGVKGGFTAKGAKSAKKHDQSAHGPLTMRLTPSLIRRGCAGVFPVCAFDSARSRHPEAPRTALADTPALSSLAPLRALCALRGERPHRSVLRRTPPQRFSRAAQNVGAPDFVSQDAAGSLIGNLVTLAAAGRNPTDITIPTQSTEGTGPGSNCGGGCGTAIREDLQKVTKETKGALARRAENAGAARRVEAAPSSGALVGRPVGRFSSFPSLPSVPVRTGPHMPLICMRWRTLSRKQSTTIGF
jgi:hypothetical protein